MIVPIALVLGFTARGVIEVWPSAAAVMPLVLLLAYVVLVSALNARPRPKLPTEPDELWRKAADE